jgi:uncharacterized membrane protein SpoIIM required for sporulation
MTITLRSAEFRRAREGSWRRLDEMVALAEKKGIGALSADEAEELPLLYQAAVSSLSVARNIALDRALLLYLENLTLRAYLVVYGPRAGVMRNLALFFTRGFPRGVRAIRRHLAIVFAVMAAGIAAGFLLVRSDVSYFSLLMPEMLVGDRGPDSTASDLLENEIFAPWGGFVSAFIVFANSLFRHNAIIGIFSFGLGFALGVPTLALIAYNGVIIGAFIALHARAGLTADFIGWLSIHGVTEILAILLCGASGLVVAEKILFPGPISRIESLALHGRRAASVVAGAVVLFFIAGIIEGGFRQLVANTPARCAFALATGILWALYFILAGAGGGGSD